jgi:hypothetical protein
MSGNRATRAAAFALDDRVEVKLSVRGEWLLAVYIRREADGAQRHAVTIDGEGSAGGRRRTVPTRRLRHAPWTCHAHPPSSNGEECGNENLGGESITIRWFGEMRGALVCCAKCGCTKIASDDRARRRGIAP